ncbi:Chaperonin CPN60-2, mitochondrial [Melia azedarach]|nr:Chaperonin CPN60-2, mitochondrial [Melia azedarach]
MSSIPSMLGSCREVRIIGCRMVVIGGSGSQEDIEKRRQQLLTTIKGSKSNFQKKLLCGRFAELSRRAAIYKMPVHSIASTAGFDGLAVVEKILEQEDIDFGYDPAKGRFVS